MARYYGNEIKNSATFSASAGLGPYEFRLEAPDESHIDVYFNSTRLKPMTDYTVKIDAHRDGEIQLLAISFLPSFPSASDIIRIDGASNAGIDCSPSPSAVHSTRASTDFLGKSPTAAPERVQLIKLKGIGDTPSVSFSDLDQDLVNYYNPPAVLESPLLTQLKAIGIGVPDIDQDHVDGNPTAAPEIVQPIKLKGIS